MTSNQPSYENPVAVYAQLNHQQQTALAQEFLRGFLRSGNPRTEQFSSLNPKRVTPQQLGAMHQFAREEQLEILERVLRHPIVSVLLRDFRLHELATYIYKRSLQPWERGFW